jgi:hypothetical protein
MAEDTHSPSHDSGSDGTHGSVPIRVLAGSSAAEETGLFSPAYKAYEDERIEELRRRFADCVVKPLFRKFLRENGINLPHGTDIDVRFDDYPPPDVGGEG